MLERCEASAFSPINVDVLSESYVIRDVEYCVPRKIGFHILSCHVRQNASHSVVHVGVFDWTGLAGRCAG